MPDRADEIAREACGCLRDSVTQDFRTARPCICDLIARAIRKREREVVEEAHGKVEQEIAYVRTNGYRVWSAVRGLETLAPAILALAPAPSGFVVVRREDLVHPLDYLDCDDYGDGMDEALDRLRAALDAQGGQ